MWTEALERADAAHLPPRDDFEMRSSVPRVGERRAVSTASVRSRSRPLVLRHGDRGLPELVSENMRNARRKRTPATTARTLAPPARSCPPSGPRGGESRRSRRWNGSRRASPQSRRRALREFARATRSRGRRDVFARRCTPANWSRYGERAGGARRALAAQRRAPRARHRDVPLLCVAAAAAAPRLMPASQAAASHTSRRSAARSGTERQQRLVPTIELLGAAARCARRTRRPTERSPTRFARCSFRGPKPVHRAALGGTGRARAPCPWSAALARGGMRSRRTS